MAAIEIQTVGEGTRLEWVTIYSDTDAKRAVQWGDDLITLTVPQPHIRLLDKPHGKVIGAWQFEGFVEDEND